METIAVYICLCVFSVYGSLYCVALLDASICNLKWNLSKTYYGKQTHNKIKVIEATMS